MLKQSKIWQRGKPKFDTSQSDGRVAILSAERARSRVSAAAKFMFAPILILTATMVMKSSYQKYRTKTSENKHKQIHPDWQPTGDSSRGNGVRPAIGWPKNATTKLAALHRSKSKVQLCFENNFQPSAFKNRFFRSGLENARRLSLRPPETVSASNQICTINLNYFVN